MKIYKKTYSVEELAELYQKLKGSIFLRLNQDKPNTGEYKKQFYDINTEEVLGYEWEKEMNFQEFVSRIETQF